MSLTLRYGVRSDVGHVREGNEDAGYAGPRLVAIADGMGGAVAGEVASRTVIGRLAGLEDDDLGPDVVGALSDAVRNANGDLGDLVDRDPSLAGMGTTITALLAEDDRLALVHVGDSRCYLFRDGVLTQVTRDHTLVQELVDAGEISEEEAAVHPKRNIITRVLDGRGTIELDVSVRAAQRGDRYLLCSDGLSGYVSPETLADAVALPDPQDAADRLVDLALRAGGVDNVTAVVADIVEGPEGSSRTFAGAAAEESATDAHSGDDGSAAGRADSLRRQALGLGLLRRGQPSADTDRRRSRWLVPGIGLGLVLVLVLALLGGWLYVRSQWYVGADGSDVALYRGVPGSVGPVELASLVERGPALMTLTPEIRRQVEGKITTGNEGSARRILAEVEKGTLPAGGNPDLGPVPAVNPSATGTGGTSPVARVLRTATPTRTAASTAGSAAGSAAASAAASTAGSTVGT
jgi:serine/threonine protein phosphatase PrpC